MSHSAIIIQHLKYTHIDTRYCCGAQSCPSTSKCLCPPWTVVITQKPVVVPMVVP